MAEKFYEIENWHGGWADSLHLGGQASLYEAVGVDIFSEPGILKVSQKLEKESASVVVDFIKCHVHVSDGNSYFGGDTGKIYKRTSAGAWSVVHTAAGAILDIAEYDSYIYYTLAASLGRQSVANASSEATWSSHNDSWQSLTSASYHPLAVQSLKLFIGNNRDIASVDDAGTFTSNGTPDVTFASLPHNYVIKCLKKYFIDLLIGTEISANYDKATIYRWDTVSPTYNTEDEITQNGINCIIITEADECLVQAGTDGYIYDYDGAKLHKRRQIRGDYENKTMTVHPNSNCNFKGRALFGVSNVSGNPCKQGVFALARKDENYPWALVLEYVISPDKASSVEIGSLVAIGNTLLAAWKDGTTYGVDVIDWTEKYSGAYVETIVIGDEQSQNLFEEYVLTYKSLPADTALTLSYYDDYASSATALTLTDDSTYNRYRALIDLESATMRFKIAFTVSSNNAPELRKFWCKWFDENIV